MHLQCATRHLDKLFESLHSWHAVHGSMLTSASLHEARVFHLAEMLVCCIGFAVLQYAMPCCAVQKQCTPASWYAVCAAGATASTSSTPSAASGAASPAPSGWFRPFSMLGGSRKAAEDLKTAALTPSGLPLAQPPRSRTPSFTSSGASPSVSPIGVYFKRTSSEL